MMILNQEELIEYLGISKSSLKTNFPKLCQKQLEKGRLIRKRGKGDSAIYEIETVIPKKVDKSEFSSRPVIKAEDLEGEIWKTISKEPLFEVSNLGRVRNKQTKILHQGTDIIPLQFIGFNENQNGNDVVVDGSTSQKKLCANLSAQIVSEETGIISVAMDYTLTRDYTPDGLRKFLLMNMLQDSDIE